MEGLYKAGLLHIWNDLAKGQIGSGCGQTTRVFASYWH